jgi:DNA-directed RNA polymerase specialized sigma24 family protein
VEGWKHAEIAAALGIAEGTSKSQLFKARAQVRRWLSREAPGN